MRPMYETKSDLQRESSIVDEICAAWGCDAKKNPCPPYKIDWSLLVNGEIKAMIEIKSSPKKYASYRLAHHKYRDLIANAQLIKTFIAVSLPDGIHYQDITKLTPDRFIWWEDGRQRDKTDNEPAAQFSWSQFNKLTNRSK